MIPPPGHAFPVDATERALPSAASALALMAREQPGLLQQLRERHARWALRFGALPAERQQNIEAAILLGVARFGQRHGRYGSDFHAYHNEQHALDLLLGRINRLHAHPAASGLGFDEWLALELFAACHDLRQREHDDHQHAVGANESASVAEALRILELCGLGGTEEAALHAALALMIAGSTFDARPDPGVNAGSGTPPAVSCDPEGSDNSAELAAGGGALAPRLPALLEHDFPIGLATAHAPRGLHLACIAADLDTANVGEAFESLCRSAVELAEEREMRAGRRLGAAVSAVPCRDFLLNAQIHYLDELHRFSSAEGEALLGEGKRANQQRMHALVEAVRRPGCEFQQASTGSQVLAAFQAAAQVQALS